jgi:hypothetical protein
VRESDEATLSSRTMATITAAARTIYPYDAWLDDVYAREGATRSRTSRSPGTIADAAMVVRRAQRRELR